MSSMAPAFNVTRQAADYTANAGDAVVCDGNGVTQNITLPAVFALGSQVAVIRGNNNQTINVKPGAGVTIGGQSQWQSPGDLVGQPYGGHQIVLLAVSQTLWLPVSYLGFNSPLSGSGIPVNDLEVHGTLYMAFNMWLTNTRTVTATGPTTGSDLVLICTGAGGYTITADTTVGIRSILFLKNNTAGTVTFTPNGTGTIDGGASLVVAAGMGTLLMSLTQGSNGNWTRLI